MNETSTCEGQLGLHGRELRQLGGEDNTAFLAEKEKQQQELEEEEEAAWQQSGGQLTFSGSAGSQVRSCELECHENVAKSQTRLSDVCLIPDFQSRRTCSICSIPWAR